MLNDVKEFWARINNRHYTYNKSLESFALDCILKRVEYKILYLKYNCIYINSLNLVIEDTDCFPYLEYNDRRIGYAYLSDAISDANRILKGEKL